jgi:UDP-glucose:(heptosyl)LPS alpha-1,3-glucosyltransferase
MMETVTGLLERGWNIRLVARICEIEDQPSLRWTRIPTPRKPFVIAFPLFAATAGLRIYLSRRRRRPIISLGAIVPNRVDVVTVQFCQAAFARQGIQRSSRPGWLRRIHGRIAQALALGLERWCYRPKRLARMTAVSELVKDELEEHYRLGSIPIDVIPNGVDIDRFHPDDEVRQRERRRLGVGVDELSAVFVGGDWPRKGLDIAIEAVARAGWTLIVVGQGHTPAWEAIARERGAKVHFCGHLPEPEHVMCAADAFILPSRYEGFALVTIEAAAAGLPILVTAATGASALAERAGGRALPRDAGAFSAELQRLGANPDLRDEMRLRARAAAVELAWPRIIHSYARAYASSNPLTGSSQVAAEPIGSGPSPIAERSPAHTSDQEK